MEAALKEVTGSEVHVDYKDGKGSLKIDFYSDDMLQKFVSLGMYDPEGCRQFVGAGHAPPHLHKCYF